MAVALVDINLRSGLDLETGWARTPKSIGRHVEIIVDHSGFDDAYFHFLIIFSEIFMNVISNKSLGKPKTTSAEFALAGHLIAAAVLILASLCTTRFLSRELAMGNENLPRCLDRCELSAAPK